MITLCYLFFITQRILLVITFLNFAGTNIRWAYKNRINYLKHRRECFANLYSTPLITQIYYVGCQKQIKHVRLTKSKSNTQGMGFSDDYKYEVAQISGISYFHFSLIIWKSNQKMLQLVFYLFCFQWLSIAINLKKI